MLIGRRALGFAGILHAYLDRIGRGNVLQEISAASPVILAILASPGQHEDLSVGLLSGIILASLARKYFEEPADRHLLVWVQFRQ